MTADPQPDARPGAAELLDVCDPGIAATAERVVWELRHAPLPDGWTATLYSSRLVELRCGGQWRFSPSHLPESVDRWSWHCARGEVTADTLAELIAQVTA